MATGRHFRRQGRVGWLSFFSASAVTAGLFVFGPMLIGLRMPWFLYVIGFFLMWGGVESLLNERWVPHGNKRSIETRAFPLLKQLHLGRHARRRRFDPARAALEACAMQWARVQTVLDSPMWDAKSTPEHWRAQRDAARQAADEAMYEAILLAKPLWDIKRASTADLVPLEQVERIAELCGSIETEDLAGLGRAEGTLLEPIGDVGHLLKRLADDLSNMVSRSGTPTGISAAGNRLTAVLDEIHALAQAERELDEQELQGGTAAG